MAWNFCAYCGTAVKWSPPSLSAPLESRQICAGCGHELYRNPDVHLLCLTYQTREGPIGRMWGQLLDRETLQEAVLRLLSRYRLAAGEEASPRLFAIVTDLDSDGVYLVFRAHLIDPVADDSPGRPGGPWLRDLEAKLRRVLEPQDHQVHSGVVRNGQLQLTPQSPG